MSAILDLNRKYSLKCHDRIRKLTDPLKVHYGIEYVHYHKITEKGHFNLIADFPDVNEYFFSESKQWQTENPYLQHPKFVTAGISLWEFQSTPGINELMKFMQNNLDVDHSIHYLIKHKSYYEVFAFAIKKINILKVLNFLFTEKTNQKFYRYFLREIFESCPDWSYEGVNLFNEYKGSFITPKTIEHSCSTSTSDSDFFNISKTPNLSLDFTPREEECLEHLKFGLTALQTAKVMYISKRTVEGYFENIKAKLGCEKKSEILSVLYKLNYFQ